MVIKSELVLVGSALAGAMASCLWFGLLAPSQLQRSSSQVATPVAATTAPIPAVVERTGSPPSTTAAWSAPAAQSRSSRWIYDVFTPPRIFYDADLHKFSVTPPSIVAENENSRDPVESGERPFALRLVTVSRIPFRLQLIGFVKTQHGVLGLFENKVTTRIFLADRGKVIPELGLTIDGLDVHPLEASALVRDLATGEITTLTNRERQYCQLPRATIVADVAPGIPRDVGAGDEIEIDGVVYQIGPIQLSPASIVITRRLAGSHRIDERRTLTLPEPDTGGVDAPST